MATPFIGEIRMFAGVFAPVDWAFCNGQIISVSENPQLFSLIGTSYGGDGRTTFALPDMRGRIPLSFGQGPGLSHYFIGQRSGQETVALTEDNLPAHTHLMSASTENATQQQPDGMVLAKPSDVLYESSDEIDPTQNIGNMNQHMIDYEGGSQPHENIQPYLCLNFIISLKGVYPSRS